MTDDGSIPQEFNLHGLDLRQRWVHGFLEQLATDQRDVTLLSDNSPALEQRLLNMLVRFYVTAYNSGARGAIEALERGFAEQEVLTQDSDYTPPWEGKEDETIHNVSESERSAGARPGEGLPDLQGHADSESVAGEDEPDGGDRISLEQLRAKLGLDQPPSE